MRTADPVGDLVRERPLVDGWSPSETQELAQCCGVRVKAVGEHRVSHVLEVCHIGVAWDEVEKRRLDEGQRTCAVRATRVATREAAAEGLPAPACPS